MNWTGSLAQKTIQLKSINIICILIIPTAFMLQTIDAWLFSTTYRIGWDSTNMGAYFISGAFVAGLGALVTMVYVIRRVRGLDNYITEYHFDKLMGMDAQHPLSLLKKLKGLEPRVFIVGKNAFNHVNICYYVSNKKVTWEILFGFYIFF